MSAFTAVLWKDLHEMLLGRSRQIVGVALSSFMFVGLAVVQSFAIRQYLPVIMMVLLLGMLTVVITVVSFSADAVAGERERHTLETLLSFPVTGTALYWAKISAMLIVGVGNATWTSVLGIVVVTSIFGAWDQVALPLTLLPIVLLGACLVGGLLAAIGLIVSARSRTIQQAGMIMGFAMIPVMIVFIGLPVGIVTAGAALTPATTPQELVGRLVLGFAVAVGVMVALVVGLVVIGLRLFERHRLMLS